MITNIIRLSAAALAVLILQPLAFGQISREPARPELQAAMIQLTVRGFEPPALTLSPGKVSIIVRDRIFSGDLDLVFERLEPASRTPVEKLAERKAPDAKWQDHRILPPGLYRVFDKRFPQWECIITVEPQM